MILTMFVWAPIPSFHGYKCGASENEGEKLRDAQAISRLKVEEETPSLWIWKEAGLTHYNNHSDGRKSNGRGSDLTC